MNAAVAAGIQRSANSASVATEACPPPAISSTRGEYHGIARAGVDGTGSRLRVCRHAATPISSSAAVRYRTA